MSHTLNPARAAHKEPASLKSQLATVEKRKDHAQSHSSASPRKKIPSGKLLDRFKMFEQNAQSEKHHRAQAARFSQPKQWKFQTQIDRRQKWKQEREQNQSSRSPASLKKRRISPRKTNTTSRTPSTKWKTSIVKKKKSDVKKVQENPADHVEDASLGSFADRKKAYTHSITMGAEERHQQRVARLSSRKSLMRLSDLGTGRSEEQNDAARAALGERVERQKLGKFPSLYLDEDDSTSDDDENYHPNTSADDFERPSGPGGRRRRGKNGKKRRDIDMTELYEEQPERAKELVMMMGLFIAKTNKNIIAGRQESEPCTGETLSVLMMNNDDRLSRLSRVKRARMEDMIARAIVEHGDLEYISMSNCGLNDAFLVKVLDALELNLKCCVKELSFENRGNEINSSGAIRLAEFIRSNDTVVSIKISASRGTISHEAIDVLVSALESNERIEKFSYDRGSQIRTMQHMDRIDKVLKRNSALRRRRVQAERRAIAERL